MSGKSRQNENLKRLSRKIKKYQNKQIRTYLKRICFRMNRKRRWLCYGVSIAAVLYLASVWQLRERIWSIREIKEIEYQIPDWIPGEEKDASGNKERAETSTRIRLDLLTGELEILHEKKKQE